MEAIAVNALPSEKKLKFGNGGGICGLPPEIISHIFAIGKEEQDNDEDDLGIKFPVLCSHVCRYWRNVAVGTPQFWTSIIFTGSTSSYEESNEWIIRSKQATIDIFLTLETDEEMTLAERASFIERCSMRGLPFWWLIIPHIGRWRSFSLFTGFHYLVNFWLERLSTIKSAPALATFHLACEEDCDDEGVGLGSHFAFPLFPEGTPAIKEVVIWRVNVDWTIATFFGGLETLVLGCHAEDTRIPFQIFSKALIQSPELKSLSITKSGPLVYSWPTDIKIPLLRLETVDLAYIPLHDAISLLDHIDFPTLNNLSLDFQHETVAPLIHATCCPGKQRFGTVQSLKLIFFYCDINDAYMLLSSMPQLVRLTLELAIHSTVFSQALISYSVCPALTTLTIRGLDFFGLCGLRRLIEAREAKLVPIKKLYLEKKHDYSDKEISWLRKRLESLEFYTPSNENDADDSDEDELPFYYTNDIDGIEN